MKIVVNIDNRAPYCRSWYGDEPCRFMDVAGEWYICRAFKVLLRDTGGYTARCQECVDAELNDCKCYEPEGAE
jgi:hypothetical protein